VSGFSPPTALADGAPSYALIAPSGVGYITLRAKDDVRVRLSFDAVPPKGQQRTLRLADNSNERRYPLGARRHVSVVVAVPRGVSLVLAKTDPPPTSDEDAIVLSNLRVVRTSGPPQLNAVVEDGDPGF
jgi:hypothetical protein